LKQLVIEIDKAYSYEQLIIEELKINMKKYGKEGNIVITTVDGNKIITATNRKKTPSTVVYSTGQ
jgi:ribosomal protein S4E